MSVVKFNRDRTKSDPKYDFWDSIAAEERIYNFDAHINAGSNEIVISAPSDPVPLVLTCPYGVSSDTVDSSFRIVHTWHSLEEVEGWLMLLLPDIANWLESRMGFTPNGESETLRCLTEDEYTNMKDYSTPNFAEISARGGVVNSHMSKYTRKVLCAPPVILTDKIYADYSGVYTTQSGSVYLNEVYKQVDLRGQIVFKRSGGSYGIPSSLLDSFLATKSRPTSTYVDELQHLAKTQATGNLSSAEFDLLIFAGEFNKTTAHLAHTAKRLFNIYRAIKRGQFSKLAPETYKKWKSGKRASSVADFTSEAWLEARYAWRPLLIDAEKAVNLLMKSPNGDKSRQTFRGGSSGLDTDLSEESSFTYIVGDTHYEVAAVSVVQHVVRAGILTEVDLSVAGQLGLYKIASTAWELIPFSFIVDWFFNVGNVMSSMDTNPAVKTLSNWLSTTTSRKTTGVVTITSPGQTSPNQLNFSIEEDWTDRLPQFEVNPTIALDVNLDAKKVTDVAALLWQLSKR